MSSITRNPLNGHSSGWFDDVMGMYDAYPGYLGYTGKTLRDHDHLLIEAMYAYWSRSDAKGYQYLADCYNEFVRKPDEPCLLPPPAYL